MRALFIIPTRGRPALVRDLVAQIRCTRQADSHFLVACDSDEGAPPLPELPWLTVATAPRMWLTPKLNYHAVPAAERYDAVGWLADDCWPETYGWDALLAEALQRPGIAWPYSSRRPGFPEHQLVSSCIIRELGWYFEPSLRHYWTDNVWAHLSEVTGCGRYVRDASVRHDHYSVTGGARDETYRQAEVNGPIDADMYLHWRTRRARRDADTVCYAIDKSTKAG